MSWQAYIDSTLLGSGVVSEALIAGQDGATWAKSPGLSVSHWRPIPKTMDISCALKAQCIGSLLLL